MCACIRVCVSVFCGPKFRPCGRGSGSGRATHASSAACSRNKQLEPITEEFAASASASASRRDGKVGGGEWSEGGSRDGDGGSNSDGDSEGGVSRSMESLNRRIADVAAVAGVATGAAAELNNFP